MTQRWITEQDIFSDEEDRIASGADPRPVEALEAQYSKWRETTDADVLEALEMYGSYLIGQGTGMDCSGPLSLSAIDFVFRVESIPEPEHREMTRRFQLIHAAYMKVMRSRRGKNG